MLLFVLTVKIGGDCIKRQNQGQDHFTPGYIKFISPIKTLFYRIFLSYNKRQRYIIFIIC